MRVLSLSVLVLVSLSIVFSGCRMRQQSPRIPVSCSGIPSKDDYLITARGDLLINGDKCKFKFPQNRKVKNKKSKPKDRSWNCLLPRTQINKYNGTNICPEGQWRIKETWEKIAGKDGIIISHFYNYLTLSHIKISLSIWLDFFNIERIS